MRKPAKLLLLLLLLGACHKIETAEPVNTTTDLKEVNYPASFDWATTRQISVEIAGLTALPDIRRVLYIGSPDGVVYLRQSILINKDFSGSISIPATENQVLIRCGNIRSTVEVVDGLVSFSLNTGNNDDQE